MNINLPRDILNQFSNATIGPQIQGAVSVPATCSHDLRPRKYVNYRALYLGQEIKQEEKTCDQAKMQINHKNYK